MNSDKLNQYLSDYINRKKPLGAIMITAPWGTGKTYYINHSLIPFLKDNGCEKKCIVVSLYSINTIDDLCRIIFMESKIKLNSSGKTSTALCLISKTIYHGVSSATRVNFGFKEKDYNNIFKLFDFSNCVLIFEDVERTRIEINDLLGFVNNLVEIDDISVILVASEPDLKRILGERKTEYDKIKEKSIYQTVSYDSSNPDTINQILSEFKNNDKVLFEEKLSETILTAINDAKIPSINFRSLQHGIQQYLDLFEHVKFQVDSEFKKEILLSIIIYSLRKRQDDSIRWIGDSISKELGSEKYPLYDFVYHFIDSQLLSENALKQANNDFIKQREYRLTESQIIPYIDTILEFYVHTGNDVEDALRYICLNHEQMHVIPKQICIRLYAALIALNSIRIDPNNIARSKEIIKERFKNEDCSSLYWDGAFSYDDESSLEWKEFKEYIMNINNGRTKIPERYDLKSVHEVAKRTYTKHNDGFIYYFDIDKLTEMIKNSNPKELHELRGEFLNVYNSGNPDNSLSIDYPKLKELKKSVENLLPADDPIIQLQLNYLISNLDYIIKGFEMLHPDIITTSYSTLY